MPLPQYQKTISSDNIDELKEFLRSLISDARLLIKNTDTGNPRDFAVEKISALKAETMQSGFFEITIALNRILTSLDDSEALGNFEYKLLNSTEDNSWEIIENILEGVQSEFDNFFNDTRPTYNLVRDELLEIYEYDENIKSDIALYMLGSALFQKNSMYFSMILNEAGIGTENAILSDDDLFDIFISIIDDEDSSRFDILYNNPHFYKLFGQNPDEFIFACITNDSPAILAYIIEHNSHVYETYNPEKIIKLIEETGSLHGLRKIFNNHEIEAIEERYNFSELLATDEESTSYIEPSHDIEAIKSRILEIEKKEKESNGVNYKEFQIRKYLLDVNDLAIMAAKHDAPNVLKHMMSHENFDDSKAKPEGLAGWAAWDNAPKSLEFLLQNSEGQYNQSDESEVPYILTLAITAIQGHSPQTLSAILNHITLDLKEYELSDGPAISHLVFEALKYNSQKCLEHLFEKSEEIFKDNKTSSTYLDIDQIKEQRTLNDSGAEDLSEPSSPTYMQYGDMGSGESSAFSASPASSPGCGEKNFDRIIGDDGWASSEEW